MTLIARHGGRSYRHWTGRHPQNRARPGRGASRPGRWRYLVVRKLGQRAVVSPSWEITQTSEGFLLLQSITCWRTSIEPVSCWARGAAFWLDSEARVQIAPSGIIKKRKVGFSIAVVPVGVSLMKGLTAKFFRLMSSIVSLVSSRRFLLPRPMPIFETKTTHNRLIKRAFQDYAARFSTPAPLRRSASCLRA